MTATQPRLLPPPINSGTYVTFCARHVPDAAPLLNGPYEFLLRPNPQNRAVAVAIGSATSARRHWAARERECELITINFNGMRAS